MVDLDDRRPQLMEVGRYVADLYMSQGYFRGLTGAVTFFFAGD